MLKKIILTLLLLTLSLFLLSPLTYATTTEDEKQVIIVDGVTITLHNGLIEEDIPDGTIEDMIESNPGENSMGIYEIGF